MKYLPNFSSSIKPVLRSLTGIAHSVLASIKGYAELVAPRKLVDLIDQLDAAITAFEKDMDDKIAAAEADLDEAAEGLEDDLDSLEQDIQQPRAALG